MLTLVVENQSHGTFADLRGKLVRRLAHDAPSYSRVGASGKPGAVHIEHHRYTSYRSPSDNRHHVGISFITAEGDRIVNFPRQHKQNCTSKHQATSNRFKPNVRLLKNMRNAMVDEGFLKKGVAPSYFLEGMLWSVPNQNFVAGYQQSFENYLHWLERCNANELSCANDLYWLIRENSHVCWNMQNYQTFLAAVRRYWNSGHR